MSSGSAPWALRRLIDNPESALPNGEAYQGHGYNKTQCSKKWRITNADVIGDHWVMSELTFYSDSACNQSLAPYIDTKRGDYEGTIVDRPGEACMAANPDQLRDGVYDSQSGCCRQPCTASSTKWAGGASESAQAPGGTWVGYEFIMDVSVACVEIGAVHSQNQYVQHVKLQRYDQRFGYVHSGELDFGALYPSDTMTRQASVLGNITTATAKCDATTATPNAGRLAGVVGGSVVVAFTIVIVIALVIVKLKRRSTRDQTNGATTAVSVTSEAPAPAVNPASASIDGPLPYAFVVTAVPADGSPDLVQGGCARLNILRETHRHTAHTDNARTLRQCPAWCWTLPTRTPSHGWTGEGRQSLTLSASSRSTSTLTRGRWPVWICGLQRAP